MVLTWYPLFSPVEAVPKHVETGRTRSRGFGSGRWTDRQVEPDDREARAGEAEGREEAGDVEHRAERMQARSRLCQPG